MVPNMIILSPDAAFQLSLTRFRSEAESKFGSNATTTDSGTVQIQSPDGFFQLFYLGDDAISTDGSPEQAAEVASWIRSLLPDDPGGRIWMVDQGFNGHVDLPSGVTPQMVKEGWIDHAEHPELAE